MGKPGKAGFVFSFASLVFPWICDTKIHAMLGGKKRNKIQIIFSQMVVKNGDLAW